jgi:hypothetical protein
MESIEELCGAHRLSAALPDGNRTNRTPLSGPAIRRLAASASLDLEVDQNRNWQ